jgi:hypothetical protein
VDIENASLSMGWLHAVLPRLERHPYANMGSSLSEVYRWYLNADVPQAEENLKRRWR